MIIEKDNTEIRIALTEDEARGVLTALSRTMCKGDALTVSMSLEDEIAEWVNRPKTELPIMPSPAEETVFELVEIFRNEMLPNRNQPYHYEAEIDSGMADFVRWARDRKINGHR
jgi:hypothetical protein